MNSLPFQQAAPVPNKSNKIWTIGVFVLVILCCLFSILIIGGVASYYYFPRSNPGIGKELGITPQPAEGSTRTSPEPEKTPQKPIVQLPNLFGIELGDEVRCEKCGFSFKKVPGYEYDGTWDIQSMYAPGADRAVGPSIVLLGGTAAKEMTNNDDLLKKLQDAMQDPDNLLTYSNQKNIKVDGVNAFSFDVEGTTLNGIAIKFRMVGAVISSKRIFTITGMAPVDKWGEFGPYFEAVLNSVSFFEPKPTPTPTNNP